MAYTETGNLLSRGSLAVDGRFRFSPGRGVATDSHRPCGGGRVAHTYAYVRLDVRVVAESFNKYLTGPAQLSGGGGGTLAGGPIP